MRDDVARKRLVAHIGEAAERPSDSPDEARPHKDTAVGVDRKKIDDAHE